MVALMERTSLSARKPPGTAIGPPAPGAVRSLASYSEGMRAQSTRGSPAFSDPQQRPGQPRGASVYAPFIADRQQGGNEREPSLDRGHAPVPDLLLEKLGLVPHDPSLTDRVFDPCPPLVSEFARFLPAIDLVVDGGDVAVSEVVKLSGIELDVEVLRPTEPDPA